MKVTRVEIKDINPPRDLVDAMGRQMKAEREKRSEILIAEGMRQSEILKAEGEKQGRLSYLLKAAARQPSGMPRRASEKPKPKPRRPRWCPRPSRRGNVQAVNYFVANNYIDALKDLATSPNQKVLMLPVEAASVIGAVGGIAELTREAFGGGGNSAKPACTPRSVGPPARGSVPKT